ncbi:MAG: MMPL family transporter [Solirubrobacteraceae bacterium]
MRRLARLCVRRRRVVLAAWVVALVGVGVIASGAGTNYASDFSLPGTQSQTAADLLKRAFPSQSGDVDQIVVRARRGTLAAPATRARVQRMLADVAALPRVASVAGPFERTGRGGAVSRDGRIGFATVAFDAQANDLPKTAIQRVVDTAHAARSPALQVELGGQAVERTEQAPPAATEAIGLAAAIVVLLITFGSLVAMGLPVLTALFGLGTGLAIVGALSNAVDMADFSPQLAAMIGLGVGIDYALFIVTRFREAYHANGGRVDEAVLTAMDTAGRAVTFAGVTVVISLLGMVLLGVSFLYGVAIAASLAVLFVLVASLTLTPALLGFLGRRVARPGRRARRRAAGAAAGGAAPPRPPQAPPRESAWARWAALVARRRWLCALAGTVILLAACAPALGLRLGHSDAGNNPSSTTTRKAYDLLAEGFGPGFNGPLTIVATLPAGRGPALLRQVRGAVARTPGIAAVAPPRIAPSGRVGTLVAYPAASPQSPAVERLVRHLRADVIPPLARGSGATVAVGGMTAVFIDIADLFAGKLPLFIGAVVLLSALLLLVVFRSLLIPLQAAVMNLLSIGAALGLVVAVFQDGWLRGLTGIEPGPIEAFLPVMLFAIVFGLSMDYEVFLVSRIREEWARSGDASAAVRDGLARTGRVVTAAATIMVLVFASFILGGERVIMMFGFGLAVAVFLDAFVIRVLLLPAVLEILGARTWRLPGWLDRRLPHMAVEGKELLDGELAGPEPAPERTPA